MIKIVKRNGSSADYDRERIRKAIKGSFWDSGVTDQDYVESICDSFIEEFESKVDGDVSVEEIQDIVEVFLMKNHCYGEAKEYILYRQNKTETRNYAARQMAFIEKYKHSDNNANATVDDNSNVNTHNIATINAEIHKPWNIETSRHMIMHKLRELYPDFEAKQYVRDLSSHIIYKHDESTFPGAIAPYCASISMYPFLLNGIRDLGGLSAAPKNLDSYCGMFVNLVFAIAGQFAGAIATSEFLLYFDYFARKKWGNYYFQHLDDENVITDGRFKSETTYESKASTIKYEICQRFQQVVYTINQPTGARGNQACFWNVSYFDKPFFESMFGDFVFPDGDKPRWDSLCALQKLFMSWFNAERLRNIITFPVETVAMIYKDGQFQDQDMYEFTCKEYAEGHSMFTYISDTADSLSSCCRLKNKIQTKEFSFTNGNMGLETGSKSVITLNLNRIIQNWSRDCRDFDGDMFDELQEKSFVSYLKPILERVYKYHTAYNEILYDMYNSHLLPVYEAGFINLDKQYLTIGLNGLNEAAEFIGLHCDVNNEYEIFTSKLFSYIKEQNALNRTKQLHFNTEMVPAESLAAKNYNWDKNDGYWVPSDRNLYASYMFKPNDASVNVLSKIILHGSKYIGDNLDGGSAAHINLREHLSYEQYKKLLEFAAMEGCQYFTFNVPNCQCNKCRHITKHPIIECPICGSIDIDVYDRVIGYLTKIKNWSAPRALEQSRRVYEIFTK